VAAGEWFLRTYLPVGGFVLRLDPRYLWALAPNTRTLYVHSRENGGGMALVTVNSEGFRGDELRPGDHPRIVVYGDSYIEADYARLAETFAKRLEERLAGASRQPVEVVNAGVNGYGPDQSLRRLQDEVRWLRPRGIVFAVLADNDFGDLLRNRLYRLEGGRAVEAGGVLADPARRMFEPGERKRGLELWNRLWQYVRRARRRARVSPQEREERARAWVPKYIPLSLELCRQEYEAAVVRRESRITDLVKDHYDADVSLFPDSESARYKRALLEAVLREVQLASSPEGVPLLTLVIPSAIDVCEPYDVVVDPKLYPTYERRRLSREAAEAARRAGLEVLDLWDSFRTASRCPYYHHGEDHWNAEGQDLAARGAADRILADGWLAGARRE
jgi:hypothetical protein